MSSLVVQQLAVTRELFLTTRANIPFLSPIRQNDVSGSHRLDYPMSQSRGKPKAYSLA